MKTESSCVRQVLSRGNMVSVERCSCGSLHLILGAITLRFHEEGLRSLSDTVAEALQQLDPLGDVLPEGTLQLSMSRQRGVS